MFIKNFLISLCLILCISAYSASITGTIIKVLDGDTVYITDNDGGKFKIRLAEIDAPEKTQTYGIQSKQFLESLILNKKVIVKFTTIDMYGRIVGKIYLNDTYINQLMVETGNAWFYEHYSNNELLKKLQQQAKQQQLGLWGTPNPLQPSIYRQQQKLQKRIKKQ